MGTPYPDPRHRDEIELPATLEAPHLVTDPNVIVVGPKDGTPVNLSRPGAGIAILPPAGGEFGVTYPVSSGDYLTLTTDGVYYFDLRRDSGWDIHGLSACTIEFWLNLTTTDGSTRYILSSRGHEFPQQSPEETSDEATAVWVVSGQVFWKLKTTSGTVTVNTGAVTNGVMTHVACVYDGSQMRIYRAGTLQDTATQTGTVVQTVYESVHLGASFRGPLDSGNVAWGINGKVGILRLNSTARYTTDFTPPGTSAPFANDRWLLQADFRSGPFVGYRSPLINAVVNYMVPDIGVYGHNGQSNVTIKDITFTGTSGTPVHAVGATQLKVRNCFCATGCRFALYLTNNCYEGVFENCRFTGGAASRFGVVNTGASGVNAYRSISLEVFQIPWVVGVGSVNIRDGWATPMHAALWTPGDSAGGTKVAISGLTTSHEGLATARHTAVMSNVKQWVWVGGGADNNAGGSLETFKTGGALLSGGVAPIVEGVDLRHKGGAVPAQSGPITIDLSRCPTS